MKLQSLAVIFVIIILPISLILGVYTNNQVETLRYQNSYDTKLNNATYDALKTFQLNTINNSTSDYSDSKIRDIEASVNSFFNSIASNFNMSGYNRDILKEYVPALVYTMYDGYYIYSSYRNTLQDKDFVDEEEARKINKEKETGEPETKPSTYQNNQKITGLKSYVYYSCRYKPNSNSDFVITYSLDNYITIKGIVNGKAVNDSGYLINNCSGNTVEGKATYRGITIGTETLQENVMNDIGLTNKHTYHKINGIKFYKDNTSDRWFSIMNDQELEESMIFKTEDNSAIRYYAEAEEFRKKILGTTPNIEERYNLLDLRTSDAVFEDGKEIDENGQTLAQKLGWR